MGRAVSGTSISNLIAPGATDSETRVSRVGTNAAHRHIRKGNDDDGDDAFAGLLRNADTPLREQDKPATGTEGMTVPDDMAENGVAWILPRGVPVAAVPEMTQTAGEAGDEAELSVEAVLAGDIPLPQNSARTALPGETDISAAQVTSGKPPEEDGTAARMLSPVFPASQGAEGDIPPGLAEPEPAAPVAAQTMPTAKPDTGSRKAVPEDVVEKGNQQKPSGGAEAKTIGGLFAARNGADRPLPTAPFTLSSTDIVDGNQAARETLSAVQSAAAQTRIDATQNAATAANDARPTRQVAEAVQHAFSAGRDSLTLRLYPEELGEVDISIKINDGIFRVTIASARPDTLMLLQGNQQMLSRALGDLGFSESTTQFEFTQGDGSSGSFDENRGGRGAHPQFGGGTAPEPVQMTYLIDGAIDIRL